jgi:uncharacterized protein YdeI (YjbR/CyaY-like superfamily)
MGKNHDPRVDAYIAKAAPFAQPILKHLRAIVHRACPKIVEDIKWSHPSFLYREKILCGMPAFKAHMAFGFWHQEAQELVRKERGDSENAGTLGKITRIGDLPDEATLVRYIQHTMTLLDNGVPARAAAPAKPKPPAKVPADLATALKKNKAAAKAFDNFSPSHRREYIEWITEARRDETRQKRVATTIEWLAEGKPRNWKYMNC